MSSLIRRTPLSVMFGSCLLLLALAAGCSTSRLFVIGPSAPVPGLTVRTHEGASVSFERESWRLTFSGIEGAARITPSAGESFSRDTTISYFQVAAVDSRGEDPWTQLLLTILGVIIVIGLAGVILYAAFRATER